MGEEERREEHNVRETREEFKEEENQEITEEEDREEREGRGRWKTGKGRN